MRSLIILTLFGAILVGCSDDPTPPASTTTAITKSDMHPDSTIGWMYYSLDGDSVVPAAQASTDAWDVKLPYLFADGKTRQVDVMFNSGTAGVGSTKAVILPGRFDAITEIPNGTVLRVEDTTESNRIIPVNVIPPGAYFLYDVIKHTISPAPDQTIIVQTRAGKYVKLAFTSIYQGAVSTPTLFTPMGYYHFKYVRSSTSKFN
jgi:hypothetical protein